MTDIKMSIPSLSGGLPHDVWREQGKWSCDCLRFNGSPYEAKGCTHTEIAASVAAAADRCLSAGHKTTVEFLALDHVSEKSAAADRVCLSCVAALVAGIKKVVREKYMLKPTCVNCSRVTTRTCKRCTQPVCMKCSKEHLVKDETRPCVPSKEKKK